MMRVSVSTSLSVSSRFFVMPRARSRLSTASAVIAMVRGVAVAPPPNSPDRPMQPALSAAAIEVGESGPLSAIIP